MSTMSPSQRPPALVPCPRFAPIETDRLRLRVVAADDLDAVHAYQSDAGTVRYMLYEPRTRAEVAALLEERAAKVGVHETGDSLQLAVVRRDDERVIGELYFAVRSAAQACVEVGWALAPGAGGCGYATEAARALLGFAFGTVRAHRAIAQLHPGNAASIRLCERLGMRHEGDHVESWWNKGAWEDNRIYALLAREWAARDAAA